MSWKNLTNKTRGLIIGVVFSLIITLVFFVCIHQNGYTNNCYEDECWYCLLLQIVPMFVLNFLGLGTLAIGSNEVIWWSITNIIICSLIGLVIGLIIDKLFYKSRKHKIKSKKGVKN